MENKKCNHVWEEHNAYLKCVHCGKLKIKENIRDTCKLPWHNVT